MTKKRVTHCYPLRAPVSAVDDTFDRALANPGFRCIVAPERRVAYHVCTSVIRVVYAVNTITICVGASPTSTSLSLSRVSGPLALNSEKPAVVGESSIGDGCTLVL